jgi:esterase/lipase
VILRETTSTVKELHWFENSTHCVILDKEWPQIAELTWRFIERVSK